MPPAESIVPTHIGDFRVIEFASFSEARLPAGYVLPSDGRPPLRPVKHIAICVSKGIEGYYTLFCTDTWEQVSFEFNDTIEYAKRTPFVEFGIEITNWRERA